MKNSNEKTYVSPCFETIELALEGSIADSGNAGGSGKPNDGEDPINNSRSYVG